MNREFKRYIPIWLIMFVLTNIVLVVIDVDRTNAFYISWAIVIFAFIAQLYLAYKTIQNVKEIAPRIIIGNIVALLLLTIFNIYILYYEFINPLLEWKYPEFRIITYLLDKLDPILTIILVDTFILAVDYLSTILMGQHSKRTAEANKLAREKTEVMRKLTAKARALAEATNNPQFRKIYEELRYSKSVLSEEGLLYAEEINKLLTKVEFCKEETELNKQCEEIQKFIKMLNV